MFKRLIFLTTFVLVFVVAFSTMAMAADIAISTQAGWFGQDAADREMQEIVDNVTAVSVEQFTANDQDALADWVAAHTGDGVSDLLILCGNFPDTIYPPGNAQPDGSLAELFLDDGNCIVNTGDYMFYVNSGGTNNNAASGLYNMMDITMDMWDDNTPVVVTAEGQEYTPSLVDYATDRPFHLDQLTGDWYAELILAQNAAGTRAEPVIVANPATGGRLGIFYQTSGQDDDPRGEVISEWINNWYLTAGEVPNPPASNPIPADGAVDADVATLEWTAGYAAVTHKVYLSTDATIDDADLAAETEMTMHFATLDPGATYYWRVDEVDADGNVVEGNVWGFSTLPLEAHFPSPPDGATNAISLELSWTPGKDTIMHNVHWGTDPAILLPVSMMQMGTSYDPGALDPDTTYYWRVDEFTPAGTVNGPVWSFSTIGPVEPADIPDLVAWYPLNEDASSLGALDISGNNNHGALRGGGPTFVDEPDIGQVLSLPGGSNQFVEVGAVGISGNMPKTIMCWAKADHTSIPDWTLIFGFTGDAGGAGGNGSHFNIGSLGGPGGVGAHCWGWEETIFSDTKALDWHHYAMTYDGTTIRYYGDGMPMDTDVVKSNVQDLSISGDRVHIGSRVTQDSSFPGKVADARIYSRVLSDEEIRLIGANLTLPYSPDPADGAGDVPADTVLAWIPGDDAQQQDVYLGTDADAVAAADVYDTTGIYRGRQAETAYIPDDLADGTTYYWRADQVSVDGSTTCITTGPVWSFTTLIPIPITDPDMLLYYDFESGEGSLALDQSGHSNHGEFIGSPEWVTGPFGGAVSIDIADLDYIQTAAPLGIVSNTVSVTGWVKHDELPAGWSGILTHRGTDPGCLGLQHDGTELRYMWGADQYWSFSSGLQLPVGEWYFAALTISPDQGKLYLNGLEQTATNVAPHEPTNFDSLIRVGRDHNDDRIMTSLIDEVRFYNKTLTDADIQRLLLPDVTAPGDIVKGVPDDGDWPGGEYPALAIDDNTGTKYLHFKGHTQPTGFQIEPASGASIVTGLTFTTANDSPERDPISYELSGSNDSIDGPYELIASGDIADFAQEIEWPRFTLNATAISFDNAVAYKYYQVMFPTVRDAGGANSMQIAEVELLGEVAYINLLANGGFEDGVVEPWSTYGDVTTEVVQELADAAVPEAPIEGSSCLHVVVPAAGANSWDAGLQHAPHVFETGKQYTLSAYMKSKSGPLDIRMKPERGADPWEGYGDQEFTITEEWAEYSLTTPVIEADVDPASITFHIAFTAGDFWVDDVKWYEVGAPELVFAEDFESYAAGSDLHGQDGWKGWNNDAGAGAPASDAFAVSGLNSVEVIGSADLVHEFDLAGGMLEFSAMQYIPSGTTGTTYFILLNSYDDGANQDWSVQTTFDLAAGTIGFWHGGEATILYDQWVELKYIIDLDNNTVDKYYNGELIVTDQWDDNVNGTLGAIDLYGNGASSVYYDDITIASL